MVSRGWYVELDGVGISGSDDAAAGSITTPPDGLGVPELRTEDVEFAQRDGTRHYADWYLPRIITLENVTVSPDDCPGCGSVRQRARDISTAWSRKCDDVELVIYTDCHDPEASDAERALNGPFGVVGRPRAAALTWLDQGSRVGTFPALRFDAVDHRLYVLDGDGTPGSGGVSAVLQAYSAPRACRTYPRCYPMCYDQVPSGAPSGLGPNEAEMINLGDLCAYPTITLDGTLTEPTLENLSTGEVLTYAGVVASGDAPVVIDTFEGTAVQGGDPRTALLRGDLRWSVPPGLNSVRLRTSNPGDDGTALVHFRPAVIQG
jgi:hypothetical protein